MTSPSALTARETLLHRLERLPPEGQRAAIKQALHDTGGETDFDDHGRSGFGLHLMGIYAVGTGLGDAIHHWINTARTLHGGWTGPADDPALHGAQIAWASWIMARQSQCREATTAHIDAATAIILHLSTNPTLRTYATQLARAQHPERPPHAE